MTTQNNKPLYRRLVNSIEEHIAANRLSPGDRLPAMSDLGARFGVSQITVRAALRVLADQGVIEARQRLGYFVSRPRAAVGKIHEGKLIAVLMPNGSHFFEAEILRGVMDVCQHSGYRVVVANTKDLAANEAVLLHELSRQVAGLVVFPAHDSGNYAAYADLLERGIPWVFVDRGIPGLAAPLVATDNEYGGYLATRHLLEHGQRHIYALNPKAVNSTQERLQGYRRALKEWGVVFDPAFIRQSPLYVDAVGYQLTKELLSERSSQEPFGIFALTETIAQTCYLALNEAGLRIPEDVAVVSFDDFSAVFFDPPLTAVRQEPHIIGVKAAQALLDMLQSGQMSQREIRLKPELIVRCSTDQHSDFSQIDALMQKTPGLTPLMPAGADAPRKSVSRKPRVSTRVSSS